MTYLEEQGVLKMDLLGLRNLTLVDHCLKLIEAKEGIRKYSKDFDGTLDDADVIKLTGISRNSYYKYKRELKNEQ